MNDVLARTFGGLSKPYYFRQLFFGLVISTMLILQNYSDHRSINAAFVALAITQALFYPYSRFVYESVAAFILGKNVIYGNAVVMLIMKLVTMMICWAFAVVIAPFGLVFLYFYHGRRQ